MPSGKTLIQTKSNFYTCILQAVSINHICHMICSNTTLSHFVPSSTITHIKNLTKSLDCMQTCSFAWQKHLLFLLQLFTKLLNPSTFILFFQQFSHWNCRNVPCYYSCNTDIIQDTVMSPCPPKPDSWITKLNPPPPPSMYILNIVVVCEESFRDKKGTKFQHLGNLHSKLSPLLFSLKPEFTQRT